MRTMMPLPKLFHVSIFIFLVLASSHCLSQAHASQQDKTRWDRKYQNDTYLFGKGPIPFLRDHLSLLPKGKVLDVAMGEGRNGVFLATQGFEVKGIDISINGLKKAQALAAEQNVRITTEVADLETYHIPPNAYDVILCTYYLQRDLFLQIQAALKSGGMAVIETYTIDHLKYRPRFKKQFLLQTNELLDLLKGLKVLRYQVVDDGQAAYASILAQKP